MPRKWNIFHDSSRANYHAANEITYKTEVSKFSRCNYNDAYVLVRGDITVTAAPEKQVHHLLNVSQKLMERK